MTDKDWYGEPIMIPTATDVQDAAPVQGRDVRIPGAWSAEAKHCARCAVSWSAEGPDTCPECGAVAVGSVSVNAR